MKRAISSLVRCAAVRLADFNVDSLTRVGADAWRGVNGEMRLLGSCDGL